MVRRRSTVRFRKGARRSEACSHANRRPVSLWGATRGGVSGHPGTLSWWRKRCARVPQAMFGADVANPTSADRRDPCAPGQVTSRRADPVIIGDRSPNLALRFLQGSPSLKGQNPNSVGPDAENGGCSGSRCPGLGPVSAPGGRSCHVRTAVRVRAPVSSHGLRSRPAFWPDAVGRTSPGTIRTVYRVHNFCFVHVFDGYRSEEAQGCQRCSRHGCHRQGGAGRGNVMGDG